jgi:hypothetical protein
VATTENIDAFPAAIDGVSLADGDICLVKDQTDAKVNGLYIVRIAAYWQRIGVVSPGMLVSVREGVSNGMSTFILTTNTNPIVVGQTPLTYRMCPQKLFWTARAATYENIPLSGLDDLIDGIEINSGDLVLVTVQDTVSQNGIYEASSLGWIKLGPTLANTMVAVLEGKLYENVTWRVSSDLTTWHEYSLRSLSAKAAATIDTGTFGLQMADNINMNNGDVVLLTQESAPERNGTWIVRSNREWIRYGVMYPGLQVSVRDGDSNQYDQFGRILPRIFVLENDPPIVLDETSLFFYETPPKLFWSAKVATTGNVVLSDWQTIDGVNVTSYSDLVLVRAQSNDLENGIYKPASSTWTKIGPSTTGTVVAIREGTLYRQVMWMCLDDLRTWQGVAAFAQL